jgi:hypothetical protein
MAAALPLMEKMLGQTHRTAIAAVIDSIRIVSPFSRDKFLAGCFLETVGNVLDASVDYLLS